MTSSPAHKPVFAYAADLRCGQLECRYQVYRSRRRTLAIIVQRDGQVTVRAPWRAAPDWIHACMERRVRWLERKLAVQRQRQTLRPAPRFAAGAPHYYLGRAYSLCLQIGRPSCGTDKAAAAPDSIQLYCASSAPQEIQRRLTAWYRLRARRVFAQRLADCWPAFGALGLRQPELRIRNMKTLWGSLARQRVMTLNLKLIRTPISCIDYVVVHELCHLLHAHHGPAFYRAMDEMMGDWRERKRELDSWL